MVAVHWVHCIGEGVRLSARVVEVQPRGLGRVDPCRMARGNSLTPTQEAGRPRDTLFVRRGSQVSMSPLHPEGLPQLPSRKGPGEGGRADVELPGAGEGSHHHRFEAGVLHQARGDLERLRVVTG